MDIDKSQMSPILLEKITTWKERDKDFTDLSDCSAEFYTLYLNAWKVVVNSVVYNSVVKDYECILQAIDHGSEEILKHSINELKNQTASETACTTSNCLNVCRLIAVASKHTESLTCFYMTLISYAIVKNQIKLVDVLEKNGAGTFLNTAAINYVFILSNCACNHLQI